MHPQIKQAKLETLEAIIKEVEGMKKENFENPQTILGLSPDDKMWNSGYRTALSDLLTYLKREKELISDEK